MLCHSLILGFGGWSAATPRLGMLRLGMLRLGMRPWYAPARYAGLACAGRYARLGMRRLRHARLGMRRLGMRRGVAGLAPATSMLSCDTARAPKRRGSLADWRVAATTRHRGLGGQRETVSLPMQGRVFQRTSGLGLELSSYWVEASGYRPVQVQITSPRPATADRTLFITLTPTSLYRHRKSLDVQFELVLPQGAMQASRTVSVPQSSYWQQWSLQVDEDGRLWEDLSGNFTWPRSGQYWDWTEAYPSILFIDCDAPKPDYAWRVAGGIPPADGVARRQLPNLRAWAAVTSPDLIAGTPSRSR